MSLKFSNKKNNSPEKMLKFLFVSVFLSVTLNIFITKYFFISTSDDFAKYIDENPMKIVESVNSYYSRQAEDKNKNRSKNLKKNINKIFNYSEDPVIGNLKSDRVVVEFFDYNCGYCKKAFNETISKLVQEDDDVKVVLKEMPILGPLSEMKSKISIAANLINSSKYMKVHEKLMNANPSSNSLDKLASLIVDLGFSKDELIKKANSSKVAQIIKYNRELAIEIGVNGTPAFAVGEEFIDGYIPLETLKTKLK